MRDGGGAEGLMNNLFCDCRVERCCGANKGQEGTFVGERRRRPVKDSTYYRCTRCLSGSRSVAARDCHVPSSRSCKLLPGSRTGQVRLSRSKTVWWLDSVFRFFFCRRHVLFASDSSAVWKGLTNDKTELQEEKLTDTMSGTRKKRTGVCSRGLVRHGSSSASSLLMGSSAVRNSGSCSFVSSTGRSVQRGLVVKMKKQRFPLSRAVVALLLFSVSSVSLFLSNSRHATIFEWPPFVGVKAASSRGVETAVPASRSAHKEADGDLEGILFEGNDPRKWSKTPGMLRRDVPNVPAVRRTPRTVSSVPVLREDHSGGPQKASERSSWLQTADRRVTTDSFKEIAACGSGIFAVEKGLFHVSWQIGVNDSINCWMLCHFLEDAVYSRCESQFSPSSCLELQLASSSLIPRNFQRYCHFTNPGAVSPRFDETTPDSEFCLGESMELWLNDRRWTTFEQKRPPECTVPQWDPSHTIPTPAPFLNDVNSSFGAALHKTTFEEFYVVSRGPDIFQLSEDTSLGADIMSSIVPKERWDSYDAAIRSDWSVVYSFEAPVSHEDFSALTMKADKVTSTAGDICLFATSASRVQQDGTVSQYIQFGMLPGVSSCSNQIGILRVAALEGGGVTMKTSKASINRETGFNLCVARRWTVVDYAGTGFSKGAQMATYKVTLDSGCASHLSPYSYETQLPILSGEWEQYFVALLYPFTRGISGLQDRARCPWKTAVQYGLKCFTSIEQESFLYKDGFPMTQLVCRRLGLNLTTPSSFSRLAVMQNDHDIRMAAFLGERGSRTWVGLFQPTQVMTPVKSSVAEKSRVAEKGCPDSVLEGTQGDLFHRHSELAARCKAEGGDIDNPPWQTTRSGKDGDIEEMKPWDIPWCAGHPKTETSNRWVDCAAVKVEDDGRACVVSLPCDEPLPGFCTYPVDYGPRLVTQDSRSSPVASDSVSLTPRVSCQVGQDCTLQFDYLSPGKLKGEGLSVAQDIWGVESTGTFIGIKASCLSGDSAMAGPFRASSAVSLGVDDSFRSLVAGVYEICYCTTSARVYGLTSINETRVAECQDARGFTQLVGTLVLEDPKLSAAFPRALLFPLGLPDMSVSSKTVIRHHGTLGSTQTSFCGWHSSDCVLGVLKRPAADGSDSARKNSEINVSFVFKPVADPPNLNAAICATAVGDSSTEVAVTVNAASTLDLTVPVEVPESFFYAVCESPGGHFLGLVTFRERVRPSATDVTISRKQLVFVDDDITKASINLSLQGKITSDLLSRSRLYAVVAAGISDTDCSSATLGKLSDQQKSVIPFPENTAVRQRDVEVKFSPGLTAAKLCWVETIHISPTLPPLEMTNYLGFIPPPSAARPLPVQDSRCFLSPADAPCELKLFPQLIHPPNNPDRMDPFFPPEVLVYMVPSSTSCPTNPADSLYTEADAALEAAGNEEIPISAASVRLALKSTSREAVTVEVDERRKPWLAEHRSANLCWLYGHGPPETGCPSPSECVANLGKVYLIGADKNQARKRIECTQADLDSCVVSVEGFNMNLYERVDQRLAALNQCGTADGLGIVPARGRYYNDPISGSSGQTGELTGGTQQLPPGVEASTSLSEQLASLDFSEHSTAKLGRASVPEWSFLGGDESQAFNATSLNFVIPPTPAYQTQMLCFRSSKESSASLTEFQEPLGYVFFIKDVYAATVAVTRDSDKSHLVYKVEVIVAASAEELRESTAVYVKTAETEPAGSTIKCDAAADMTSSAAGKLISPHSVETAQGAFGWSVSAAEYHIPTGTTGTYAVCWSQSLVPSDGLAPPLQRTLLVGYVTGPSLSAPLQGREVSCGLPGSLDEGRLLGDACLVTLAPEAVTLNYTGGLASGTNKPFLAESGRLFMVKSALGGECPANLADLEREAGGVAVLGAGRSSAVSGDGGSSVVSVNSIALSLEDGRIEEQVFKFPPEGRTELQRVGKTGLCYGLPGCAANGAPGAVSAANSGCVRFVGVALWAGPSEAGNVILCDKLTIKGCVFRVEGHNMDRVDYTVSRVAITEKCGSTENYEVATLVQKTSQDASLLEEQSRTSVEESDNTASVEFAVAYTTATIKRVCWNPFSVRSQQATASYDTTFVVDAGAIVFLPHTLVTFRRLDVTQVDAAVFRLQFSVLVPAAEMEAAVTGSSTVEHYVYRSPNADSVSATCTDEDVETREEWQALAELRQNLAEWLTYFGETVQDNSTLGPVLAGSVIGYRLSPQADPSKACWRSIFRDLDGAIVHSYRRFLAVVPAGTHPEIDTTVADQPASGVVLCGMGTATECSVTVKAKHSVDGLQQGFLLETSTMYAVAAAACPDAPTDELLVTAATSSPIASNKESVRLNPSPVQPNEMKKTFFFPESGREWLSRRGAAVLCWSYGVGGCPQVGPCVVELGSIYWKGPRPVLDTGINDSCHSSTGCSLSISGLNLQMIDHSYSRLALLESCGNPEGLGLLDIDEYPLGYDMDPSPPPQIQNLFVSESGLESGRFMTYGSGHLVLTCRTNFHVVVSEAVWEVDSSAAAKSACTPMDVRNEVHARCAGKSVCSLYPYLTTDAAEIENSEGLDKSTLLKLPDPCPSATEGKRKLTGKFECTTPILAEAALLQVNARQRVSKPVYTSPSTETVEMSFRVPGDAARLYEICWNPNDAIVALDPKQYTMKLGTLQIVPAAGLHSLVSVIVDRIDKAYVEVAVRGAVGMESAAGTFIYLKPVPQGEGKPQCDTGDPQATSDRKALMSYEAETGTMAVMRYKLLNPTEEQILCWGWMSELMVSAGGFEQRSVLGRVPGTVGPRAYPWGQLSCSGDSSSPCTIIFEPESLQSVYPFPGDGAAADVTDYSKFPELKPVMQGNPRLGLVAGQTTCPQSPSHTYVDIGSSDVQQAKSRTRVLSNKSVKLIISDVGIGSVSSTLTEAHRRWLAAYQDAAVCWVNVGDCSEEASPVREKPCVSTVGILSWIGPLPAEWALSPLTVDCKTNRECTFVVPGRNLYVMDLSRTRVAVVESCGSSQGPGVAPITRFPPLYKPVSTSDSEEILFLESSATPAAFTEHSVTFPRLPRAAAGSLKQPARNRCDGHGRRHRSPGTSTGRTVRELGRSSGTTSCAADTYAHLHHGGAALAHPRALSTLQITGQDTPNNSVDDSLEVKTMLTAARDYKICWNPKKDASAHLPDFTVELGVVHFYGFRTVEAFCFSGSVCELPLVYVASDTSRLNVGVKAVDCSDADLSTDLGGDGKFSHESGKNFFLPGRILPRDSVLTRYELCWCDKDSVDACAGTDYSESIGSLRVQFVSEIQVMCPPFGGSCVLTLSKALFERDKIGTFFLTKYTGGPSDCTSAAGGSYKMTPQGDEGDDLLQLPVVHSDLVLAVGGATGGRGQFAICWATSSTPEEIADLQTVTMNSPSPARLGVLSFAGPKAPSDQPTGQVVVIGTPAEVRVSVVGATVGRMADVMNAGLPASFKEIRMVPKGQCGIAGPAVTAVLKLSTVSLGRSNDEQEALYVQEVILDLGVNSGTEFDICWCEGGKSCTSESHFTAVVSSVRAIGPQRGVQVVCTYDTQCPFRFKNTPDGQAHNLVPVLLAMTDNCTTTQPSLPAGGFLAEVRSLRRSGKTTETDTDSVILEFLAPVPRSSVFTDENSETRRELEICYCAVMSTGCGPGRRIKVGTIVIMDVWIGSITATLTDKVYAFAIPPFSGVGGVLKVTAGSTALPVTLQPLTAQDQPPTYLVDVSVLATIEQAEGYATVKYCERLVSEDCEAANAVYVMISEIFMKGPVTLTWVDTCNMGRPCVLTKRFFNPFEDDRVAIMFECGEPQSTDYGINNETSADWDNIKGSSAEVSFSWKQILGDLGVDSMSICWCAADLTHDCSTADQYEKKVGTLRISGLRTGHRGSCAVGTVCELPKGSGYNLNEVKLRILAHGCGASGAAVPNLPDNGNFIRKSSTGHTSASFQLQSKLLALSEPPAFLCQCPKPANECSATEDFAWKVGSYEFTGPSLAVTVTDAVSANPLQASLTWRGTIDVASDFVVLSSDACTGLDSSVVAGLPDHGLGKLLDDGSVSWPTPEIPGNVYYICYCRSTNPLVSSVSGSPFPKSSKAALSPLPDRCETFSAYRIRVGTILVTGPRSGHKPFSCSAGGICTVTVEGVATSSTASEDIVQASIIDLREKSCSSGESLMTGELSSWRYLESTVQAKGTNLGMRGIAQEYGFSTVMLLPAGSYVVCWRSARDAPLGVDVGRLYVKGPVKNETRLEVLSGADFDVSVRFAGASNADEVKPVRIHIYPIPSGDAGRTFRCVSQDATLQQPFLRFSNVDRPPDAVTTIREHFHEATWNGLTIVIDSGTPDQRPGDEFAICFCDGGQSDCSVSKSYFIQVGTLKVAGPATRTVTEPLPVGRFVTYTLIGVDLPTKNALLVLPSRDIETQRASKCGQVDEDQQVFPSKAQTEPGVTDRVTFKDLLISSATHTVLVCWCGGENCTSGGMFRTQIGEMPVQFPQFIPVSATIGGSFSVTMKGSVVRPQDVITIVGPKAQCGADGTEVMDATLVKIPSGSPVKNLDRLGTSKVVKSESRTSHGVLDSAARGEALLWQSWSIQTTETVSGSLKVCYCSSAVGPCKGKKRFNVWIGSVSIVGPSTKGIRIVATSEGQQGLELRGEAFSLTNKLRYYPKSLSSNLTALQMQDLCNLGSETTTVIAEEVEENGTVERFPVSLTPGVRYILCWSSGVAADKDENSDTGEQNSGASQNSFLIEAGEVTGKPADLRLMTEKEHRQESSDLDEWSSLESSTFSMATGDSEDVSGYDGEFPSSSVELSAKEQMHALDFLLHRSRTKADSDGDVTAAAAPALRWTFLADIVPDGFRPGRLINLVQNFSSETLVVPGVANNTDVYAAYLGESTLADCQAVKQTPVATLSKVLELAKDYIMFEAGELSTLGVYRLCIENQTVNALFDVGRAAVSQVFWKTVLEFIGTHRFFMFPCSTGTSAADSPVSNWADDRVWLPDGMGVWTAVIGSANMQVKPTPYLLAPLATTSKFIDFFSQGVRGVVACASDTNQQVYFVGPDRLYILHPKSDFVPDFSTYTGELVHHGVSTPVDVAVVAPYVFISDYGSQLIKVLNTADPTLNRVIYPTNPVLLFAAGIEVIALEGSKVALLVADMFNHIVGRLDIDLEAFKTPQTVVVGTPWTAYYGVPKVSLRDNQGFSYPFALSHYTPSAAAGGASSEAHLLLVSELVTDRLLFLDLQNGGLDFYRQIDITGRRLVTGIRSIGASLLLLTRNWPPEPTADASSSSVVFLRLGDLIDNLHFTYPDFRAKLQSGLFYTFAPLVTGPAIQFFHEETTRSDLSSLGLKLDPKTGVISGTVSHTGKFTVTITGGDLLGSYTWQISGEAGCRAGEHFDSANSACAPCPVGTFRDQEANLQYCDDVKPNSTTVSTGSTHVTQCRCLPGFELGPFGSCRPCTSGTFKAEISDAKCTGKCPPNMHSYIQGADSEQSLNCMCDSGYYWEKSSCKPCPLGSYCSGETSLPVPCPENYTTKSTISKSRHDCVCVPGYTKLNGECVKCSRLNYKSETGDNACTACPQPAVNPENSAGLLASTKPTEAQFTTAAGATKLSDCSLCATGFFFDMTSGGCEPCRKNSYCRGPNQLPTPCSENSMTSKEGAESAFDCKCPKGYGTPLERNPLDNTLLCIECPRNTFQHIDGAVSGCLPCPPFTMTQAAKSTSMSACVAIPGYFLPKKLEDILTGLSDVDTRVSPNTDETDLSWDGLGSDERDGTTDGHPAMDEAELDFQKLRTAETKYETMSTADLLAVTRICQEGIELIQQVIPEVKMRISARSFEACAEQCARNVYCTSFTFTRAGDLFPLFSSTVTNHTGTFVVSYSACELHYYGTELDDEEVASISNRFQGTDVAPGHTVSCTLQRPAADSVWRDITYEECPTNAYCPGDREAKIYECPSSAVTLANRASRVEHCKCIPGYQLLGRQCEACKLGSYKNTTDNTGCTDCPTGFTTAATASISAYDCACAVGLYMQYNSVEASEESPAPPANESTTSPESDGTAKPGGEQTGGENAEHTGVQEDIGSGEETGENTKKPAGGNDDVDTGETGEKGEGGGQKGSTPDGGLEADKKKNTPDSGSKTEDAVNSPTPPSTGTVNTEGGEVQPGGGGAQSAVQLIDGVLVRSDKGKLGSGARAIKSSLGSDGLFKENAMFIADRGTSLAEMLRAYFVDEEVRKELEKVVKLHHCVPCYKHMYCPGLWLDPPANHTHMPPQLCPEGSNVPLSTVLADSVEKCLCLPGYGYSGTPASSSGDQPVEATMSCTKCASGTYKELQENSPCAGRCMRDAETIEGAVSKIQCFCKIGKYAVEAEEGTISCQDCIAGGVCPGGLKKNARQAIEENHSYTDITLEDHQVPFPAKGYFAVYKPLNETVWRPSMVPMSANFTGDAFLERPVRPVISSGNTTTPTTTTNTTTTPSSEESGNKAPSDQTDVPESGGEANKPVEQDAGKDQANKNPNESTSPPADSATSSPPDSATSPPAGSGASNEGEEAPSALQLGEDNASTPSDATVVASYDRLPDIHPCFDDRRCKGGPHNSCVDGSAGYLCSACVEGHCQIQYRGSCQECRAIWLDILVFASARLVVCLLVWVIATLSILAVQQQACIHPILIRILISNVFSFSIFGLMPETSKSRLFDWAPIYRNFFFNFFFMTHPYFKVSCFVESLGLHLDEVQLWYWQRFFQIFVPFLDAVTITVLGLIAVGLYKLLYFRRIYRVRMVLQEAREAHPDDFWTSRTIEKVENDRCLGMFRYISPASASGWTNFVRLMVDLIPAYTVIWFWHFPSFMIECTQLMGCINTRYKNEEKISVLSAWPTQLCDMKQPYFLAGIAVGGAGVLVWGVGVILAFIVYMTRSHRSDSIEQRFKYGFLASGYRYQYRWWDGVVSLRKACVALIITMQAHLNSTGEQEVFRNSANLTLSVLYAMLQLQLEPFDQRSHNLANRAEFYGLLVNIINGVIFQGSFYFDVFKYFGGVPIGLTGFFYLYILWNLFVEWGRMAMMRPYLVRIPSFWRYYNRVTRSLARLYTSGNAKIYYNYITKDMVLEAATKSRVFHLRRLLLRRKKTAYRKINYENRTYFVASLSDSLSQLVIAWCQFTIPGDWLDFTIRYAFCYCFWQRHQGSSSFRVPLDLEEFEAIRPNLFSEWYYEREDEKDDEDDAGLFSETGEVMCNQAEQELLDLILDDDVYDDSPITLMELYVAVQSMRYIPQRQLRRLHLAYRERMAAASNSMVPQLRKENEELEAELQGLNHALQEVAGDQPAEDGSIPAFSLMDFFFTVEMVNQAQIEVGRLRGLLDRLIDEITRQRVAKAMAAHIELGMNEEADVSELLNTLEAQLAEDVSKEDRRVGYLPGGMKKKMMKKRKSKLSGRRLASASTMGERRTLQLRLQPQKSRSILRPEEPGAGKRTLGLRLHSTEEQTKRKLLAPKLGPRKVRGVSEPEETSRSVMRPDGSGLESRQGSIASVGEVEGKRTLRLGTSEPAEGPKRTLKPAISGKRTLQTSVEDNVASSTRAVRIGSTSSIASDETAAPPKRVVRLEPKAAPPSDAPAGEEAPPGQRRALRITPPVAPGASEAASESKPETLQRRRTQTSAEVLGRRRVGLGTRTPPPEGELSGSGPPEPAASGSKDGKAPERPGLPVGKRRIGKPGGAPKQE